MMQGRDAVRQVRARPDSLTRSRRSGTLLVSGIFLLGSWLTLQAAAPTPAEPGGDFGQYLVAHQADLSPFFSEHGGELFRQGLPLVLGLLGWITLLTMLAGWGLDVLMSRAFAYFFAPAYPEFKRAIAYATGRLILSAVYTFLMGLAIVLTLRLTSFATVIAVAMAVLILVALAAQIVWVLYLYHADVPLSALFYLAIIIVHALVSTVVAGLLIGSRAPSEVVSFMDGIMVPMMQAEIDAKKHELARVEADRKSNQAQTEDLQSQLSQALAAQSQLNDEIAAKKKSDFFVFSQIGKVRAEGNLEAARDQLTSFLASFPTSTLDDAARAQLAAVDGELQQRTAQQQQQAADASRLQAAARADFLARVARGDVALSEMRSTLIGKTRNEVNSLLGPPSSTASDTWNYSQQMVFNPMTHEKFGLTVNFFEGAVQGVDYNRGGSGP